MIENSSQPVEPPAVTGQPAAAEEAAKAADALAGPQPPQPRSDDIAAVLRRLQAVVGNLEARIIAGEQAAPGVMPLADEIATRDRQIRELVQRTRRLEVQLAASERARGALEERAAYQLELLETRAPFWSRARKAP